jgi:hypothetical protein
MERKQARMAVWVIVFGVFAAMASTWWAVSQTSGQGRPTAGASQASAPDGALRENGSQPLVRARNLVVSGRVLGLPQGQAGLQVVVHVGGQAYAAQVQDQTYMLDIGVPDPSAMVVVEARAGTVHFKTLAGSVGYLRQQAGGD